MSLVSLTGTRYGMTRLQLLAFRKVISELKPTFFRHGDCKGADDEGARAVKELFPECRLVAHPGPDGEWRAYCPVNDEVTKEKNHFARNRDLVDLSETVIVCPLQMERQEKGGTWYTHDFAIKKGKHVIICLPDGDVTETKPVTRL